LLKKYICLLSHILSIFHLIKVSAGSWAALKECRLEELGVVFQPLPMEHTLSPIRQVVGKLSNPSWIGRKETEIFE
jgi:hypothetical protein